MFVWLRALQAALEDLPEALDGRAALIGRLQQQLIGAAPLGLENGSAAKRGRDMKSLAAAVSHQDSVVSKLLFLAELLLAVIFQQFRSMKSEHMEGQLKGTNTNRVR
jgi:hypothetical protein